MMKRIALLIGLMTLTVGLCHGAAGRGQTRDAAEIPLTLAAGGEPQAVIVIAPERPRMVTLAALELRHYVEKMSGARLPIVTDATGIDGVKIYLGNSPGVERLGVDADGLQYGAFRVASGVDWIVLIGTDIDYVPPMDIVTITPTGGVVEPGFPVRDWLYYGYGGFPFEEVMYGRRVGMNSGIEKVGPITGPHGLTMVTSHPAMKEAHPEYYAMIGGKPDTEHRGYGTPNFTSQGLIDETVKYVRFMYDQFDVPMVDLWPVDGLVDSQDEESMKKSTPELVWEFTNRVAQELYKTHPDRLVSGGAYASYREPPQSIEKFSPNVLIQISNTGRARKLDDSFFDAYRERLERWAAKLTPGNILRYENNRSHISNNPIIYPVLHPRSIARDIQFLRGLTVGETGEQSQQRMRWSAPALNHVNLYVQARMLWNPDTNVDELLDEYFTLFYGPASEKMKAAVHFAEDNLAVRDQSRGVARANLGNVPLEVQVRLRELLDAARAAAGDTVYGQRIDLLLTELATTEAVIERHHLLETAVAEARANAPLAIGVDGADLSEAEWYTLVNNRSGEPVEVGTRFRTGWDGDAIIFEVHSSVHDMENLVSTPDVYSGEYVAVSLETPMHSFYHIEISPEGNLAEGNPARVWQSLSTVETEIGDGFWVARIRIPVVGYEEAEADPHHRVAGAKPTKEDPWYFNVGRNRIISGRDVELHGFSPTGGNWRQPTKFGRLEIE